MSVKNANHEFKEVSIAIDAREQARTFRSKVGVSFSMYDDRIFGGFNIEKYGYGGYHAEEVGIINALLRGYRGTDFKKMIEIFQDAGHDKAEVYPACPLHCWGSLWNFTNPDLEIVVANTEGKAVYSINLNDIVSLPAPASVYPSDEIKKVKPLRNVQPRSESNLPVIIDKEYVWNEHGDGYMGSLINCALDYRKYAITFDQPQFVFDSVAFGMKDGSAFGGFDIQSHYYKEYRAEETAMISAMSRGYTNKDFDIMIGVIPQFIDRSQVNAFMAMQLQTYGLLNEFANPRLRIYAVHGEGRETIAVSSLQNISHLLSSENINAAAELKKTKPRFEGISIRE